MMSHGEITPCVDSLKVVTINVVPYYAIPDLVGQQENFKINPKPDRELVQ